MTPNPMKSSRQFRDNVRIFAQDAARILHQLLLSDFMMQLSRGLNDEITEFMRFSKILIPLVCLDLLCFVNAKIRIWYSKFLKYSTISIYAKYILNSKASNMKILLNEMFKSELQTIKA